MSARKRADAGLFIVNRTMSVGGNERQWVEVTSTTQRAADRRLLIAAHGSNQSPGLLRSMSGYTFDDWAHAGHVVVYPRPGAADSGTTHGPAPAAERARTA